MGSERSKVEVSGFEARYYDLLMGLITLGQYSRWIRKGVRLVPFGMINERPEVLELGCGTGIAACEFLRLGASRYVGLDISEEMLAKARRRCRNYPQASFVNHRIEQPWPISDTFDVIFMSFVMHGLEDWDKEKVLNNVREHLKEGGIFAVLDYSQMDLEKASLLARLILRKIECPLATEFVQMGFEEFVGKRGLKHLKTLPVRKGLFSLYLFQKGA